jgi:glycine C-acetyltransferase
VNNGWIYHCQKRSELLRQRSRPYLFSNSLAPAIVGASIKVLNYEKDTTLRDKLEWNTNYFKQE